MNKTHFIMFFLFIAFILSSCMRQTDALKDGWKGPIHAVIQKSIDMKAPGITNIIKTDYSESGLRLSRSWYFQNLNTLTKEELFYRDAQSRVTQSTILQLGQELQYNHYFYNKKGYLTNLLSVTSNGKLTDYTCYAYDENSQITQTVVFSQGKLMLKKNWIYSSPGHIDILESQVSDLLMVFWRHYYDATGKLYLLLSDQQRVEFKYDALGRQTEELRALADQTPLSRKVFSYDSLGNLLEVKEQDWTEGMWQDYQIVHYTLTYY